MRDSYDNLVGSYDVLNESHHALFLYNVVVQYLFISNFGDGFRGLDTCSLREYINRIEFIRAFKAE